MKLTIDGHEVEAQPGESVLEAARREGISIPTLCHHEAFEGQGCCRLCTVEITSAGRSRLAAACTYPASEGLVVRTSTPVVERIRRNIIMLLAWRAGGSEYMQKLADEYSCPTSNLTVDKEERCIMCRLCVLACAAMGCSAITTVMRGTQKRISTPYDEAASTCIGCGACAEICPTRAIEMVEAGGQRTIWNKSFELVTCTNCGQAFATREQMEFTAARTGLEEAEKELCTQCRRHALAEQMSRTLG